MRISQSRRQIARGFTLIELLVAVGITVMLVTLMLTIISNVLGGWNRSSGSLTSGNQARVVLDQLSGDLQGAIIKKDGKVWFAATVLPDTVTENGSVWTTVSHVKPTAANGSRFLTGRTDTGTADAVPSTSFTPDLTSYRFGRSGVWLRFFTTVPDVNSTTDVSTLSAPRAVSYQMLRKDIGTGQYRYQLYRAEVRPGAATGVNSTFGMGYDLFMSTPVNGSSYNVADNTSGNPGNVRKPVQSQLIANNVVDFGVRLWDSTPKVIFPTSTTHAGLAVTSTTATTTGPDGVTVTNSAYPVVAEVFVRILTDEGARLLTSYESGLTSAPSGVSDEEYWWRLVEANSQVYTRRIEIKSTSL